MKSRKKVLSLMGIIITVSAVFVIGFMCFNDKKDIDIILKKESYAYLPKEAQNYIKKVYEESGEVVLTEKNKEENKPYLNPEYVEYLDLSEEEKENVELVPDPYILDYSMNQTYSSSDLPNSFDLRNQNGHNFVSPIKNQGTTSICWAFASVENVETLYMKNNNQSYSDLVPKFSIRQMDYITSTSYDDVSSSVGYLVEDANWISCSQNCSWHSWKNPDNGSHELDNGGNFFTSSIAMANGITLTDESVLPWNEENKPIWAKDIYGYDKSLYEVDSTINMPTINADSASTELIESYVSDIKTYMMQYGGPFIGTYSPKSTCGFTNTDGKKAMKTDDCVNDTKNKDLGHAMQIIGWDDDYEYSYCDNGTKHSSVENGSCSSGELKTGKGAWILRNSWGTETTENQQYSYVYLTYDSTRLSVGFTTSMSDMKTRTWDNNYHSNPWIERKISNGLLNVDNQTKEFNTHNNYSEKIEKIKILTSTKNGKYNISILTEKKNYDNIGTITTNEAGIYTINLSDKNIILEDKIFSVKVEAVGDAQFVNDSISVFTSNVSKEPSLETKLISGIETYENPEGQPSEENVAFISSYTDKTIKIEHYLKNIPDYKKVTYKALLNGEDYSRYFFNSYGNISSDMIYLDGHITSTIEASGEDYFDRPVCGQTYTFQILYDDKVIESFPLKRICKNWDRKSTDYTESKIRFHKNDGSGYVSTIYKDDTTSFQIMKSDGIGDIYIVRQKEFFLYDRYIKSWNTKPDGTGDTYTDNYYFVYKDMDFYAQWSDPKKEKHQYSIHLNCGNTTCKSTYTRNLLITFNEDFEIPATHYESDVDGQEFIHWTFDTSSDNPIYYEEEIVRNISGSGFSSPYNKDETFYIYGIWSDSYHSVTFDANNGTGTMKGIKIINDKTARLKYNLFTRDGYTFAGWNTKADGSGTSYTDGQNISLTQDIILYAQWDEEKYTVTFKANGGTGSDTTQKIQYNTSTKLSKNTFVKEGYIFSGWNTKTDGTGDTYTDGQSVTISNDLTLYAQWVINKYTVTFKANGGTGSDTTQKIQYNTSTKLSKNTFVKEGYIFSGWNTQADGKGTSYTDGQSVTISNDLTLYAQWTEEEPYVIKNYSFITDKNYIDKIDINTIPSVYKQSIELASGYSIEVDSKNVDGKDVLYTGSKTRIKRDQSLIIEFTNIVSGDTNGDGKLNYLDYVNVYNHIQKVKHPESTKKLLTNEFVVAGDMSGDSNINYLDYVKIYQKIKELKGGN